MGRRRADDDFGSDLLKGLLIAGGLAIGGAVLVSLIGDENGDGHTDIDDLVAWLNRKVGPCWVNVGLQVLSSAVPLTLKTLLPLVINAELAYASVPKAGAQKRTYVIRNRAR